MVNFVETKDMVSLMGLVPGEYKEEEKEKDKYRNRIIFLKQRASQIQSSDQRSR